MERRVCELSSIHRDGIEDHLGKRGAAEKFGNPPPFPLYKHIAWRGG